MNEALQKHLEKLGKALSDGDVKAAGTCLSELTAFLKAEGDKGGYVLAGEYKAAMDKLQKDVDHAIEQVRSVQKLGLSFRAGHVEGPRTVEERRGMLRDHRAFMDDAQAARLAAWVGCTLLKGRGLLEDARPYVRDVYKDVLTANEKADMDPGVSTAGGALIPNEFIPELIRNVEAEGTLFPLCRRVPLATLGTTTFPTRTGGPVAYWTAPAAQGTRSAPTFSTAALTPEKLMALIAYPNEFLRGSLLADLGQFLATELVWAISYALDNALVNGDGTASYGGITGILQSNTIASVAAATGHNLMAEIDAADITEVISELPAGYALGEARWGMSLSVKGVLRGIRATSGLPLYDRANGMEPATIDGYPYTLSPRMPAASAITGSDIYAFFGNLRLSHFVGMIRGIEIATSSDALFEADMSVTRGLVHADIVEVDHDAIVTAVSAA